jgi:hypothetical protein
MSTRKSKQRKKAPLPNLRPQNTEEVKAGAPLLPLVASAVVPRAPVGPASPESGPRNEMFHKLLQQLPRT